MDARAIARFVLGVFLAFVLLTLGLPLVGIPRSRYLPPAVVYAGAKGATTGVITGTRAAPSSNPFRVGEFDYFVDYRFLTPVSKRAYTGSVPVDRAAHDSAKAGTLVPIRFEITYPVVSGIAGRGRSRATGTGWLLWAGATLLLGYLLSASLERLFPPSGL